MIILETNRILIRKFKKSDWHDLYEYLSDPEVVRYEPYDIFTQDGAKKEASKRSASDSFYAVVLKSNSKMIGNLYFNKQDFDTFELGFVFNRTYQGNGYATESAQALMDHAFEHWYARRIIAMCNPENTNSWHLLERLHMRREGVLLQNIYFRTAPDGSPIWQDTFEYAILKTEWKKEA